MKPSTLNKSRKILFVAIAIVLVVFIATLYIKPGDGECTSSFCKLTGKAVALDNSLIVANVNDMEITSTELDANYDLFFFLNIIPKSYTAMLPKKDFLNQSISEELLYNEAIKKGYELDDTEIEALLQEGLSTSGLTINDFKAELENNSIDYEVFIKFYKKQIVVTEFLEDTIYNDLSVSDLELQDFYDENLEFFLIEEQISASHILVNSSDEAKDIINKLDEDEDFSELAKEYSIGPSGPSGGDLGSFGRGAMVPEFENAAFSLQNINDYTKEPIQTQFGYHVIMLTGKQDPQTVSFEEAKEQIGPEVLAKKKSDTALNYVNELMKDADIEIFEENINEEIVSEDFLIQ
jgi:parvulin-like peptidyl-prolyl isomerase